MKRLSFHALFMALVLMLGTSLARAGSADLVGTFSYEIADNIVAIDIERIENNTQNVTTGTLYVTLRMTYTASPFGDGYNVAREPLTFGEDPTGQLGPNEYFTNIHFSSDYTQPPPGTYFVHLVVSEYPDPDTALDTGTFSNTVTISGDAGSGADNDNTIQTANLIGINDSASSSISPTTDIDFFRFNITESGQFTFGSQGDLDTVGYLYDSTGNVINTNDDTNGTNFQIIETLSPGTYYFSVGSYNNLYEGAYQVFTSFAPAGGGTTAPPTSPATPPASGVSLVGSAAYSISGSSVTVFQDVIRNERTEATNMLRLQLWALENPGDTSGYILASFEIGTLGPGAEIANIARTAGLQEPPHGRYFTSFLLVESTPNTTTPQVVDRVDFEGRDTLGSSGIGSGSSGGGGGAMSAPMLVTLIIMIMFGWMRQGRKYH